MKKHKNLSVLTAVCTAAISCTSPFMNAVCANAADLNDSKVPYVSMKTENDSRFTGEWEFYKRRIVGGSEYSKDTDPFFSKIIFEINPDGTGYSHEYGETGTDPYLSLPLEWTSSGDQITMKVHYNEPQAEDPTYVYTLINDELYLKGVYHDTEFEEFWRRTGSNAQTAATGTTTAATTSTTTTTAKTTTSSAITTTSISAETITSSAVTSTSAVTTTTAVSVNDPVVSYTAEVRELPYEADYVQCVSEKYFQLCIDNYDVSKNDDYAVYDNYYTNWDVESSPRTDRQRAVIDNQGNLIFPYKSTPLDYHYSDGIFSLTSNDAESFFFAKDADGIKFGDYTPADSDTILIRPRYYDRTGKEIIDTSNFRSATAMENGYALVSIFTGTPDTAGEFKNCIIDKSGNIVFEGLPGINYHEEINTFEKRDDSNNPIYQIMVSEADNHSLDLTRISEGIVAFLSSSYFDGKVSPDTITGTDDNGFGIGYMDLSGNIIIPQDLDYDFYGDFVNGLAMVGKYNDPDDHEAGYKIGFIDNTGALSIPMQYDDAWSFNSVGYGYAMVRQEDKYYIIDIDGKIIMDVSDYGEISGTNGKVICLSAGDKFGAVDMQGNLVLPFEYDGITGIEQDDYCMAVKDGKVYSIRFKAGAGSGSGVILGDFTGDDIVDGRDATSVLTFYAKSSVSSIPPTNEQLASGDVNKDGILDARDATDILTYYAKASVDATLTLESFIAEKYEEANTTTSSATTSTTTTTTTTTTTATTTTAETTTTAPPVTKSNVWKEKYLQAATNFETQPSGGTFRLIDINKDGIPELYASNVHEAGALWTVSNDKLIKLHEWEGARVSAITSLDPDNSTFMTHSSSNYNTFGYALWKVSENGEVERVHVYSCNSGEYTIDGKTVTEAYFNSVVGSASNPEYSVYNNNTSLSYAELKMILSSSAEPATEDQINAALENTLETFKAEHSSSGNNPITNAKYCMIDANSDGNPELFISGENLAGYITEFYVYRGGKFYNTNTWAESVAVDKTDKTILMYANSGAEVFWLYTPLEITVTPDEKAVVWKNTDELRKYLNTYTRMNNSITESEFDSLVSEYSNKTWAYLDFTNF